MHIIVRVFNEVVSYRGSRGKWVADICNAVPLKDSFFGRTYPDLVANNPTIKYSCVRVAEKYPWKPLFEEITSISLEKKNGAEVTYCNKFGCGKKLSLQESLFGKHCVEHSLGARTIKSCYEI